MSLGQSLLLLAGFALLTWLMSRWVHRQPVSKMPVEVRCSDCNRLMREPPELPGIARPPCPECGSLGRTKTLLFPQG